jgi:hypothetical protein
MFKASSKCGKIDFINEKLFHYDVPVYQQSWGNYPLSGAAFPQTPFSGGGRGSSGLQFLADLVD